MIGVCGIVVVVDCVVLLNTPSCTLVGLGVRRLMLFDV
jgi:hypothetical protein